jgi:hypothetical protein
MKDIQYSRLAAIFFLIALIITYSALLTIAGEPRIHGFFVQPSLGYGATDYEKFSGQEEYDQWLQNLTTEDRAAIDHHVERSIAVVNDLAAQYGDHPALGGLYYSIEIANNAFIPQDNYSYLASILDQVAKAVHTALPGKQLAICPFFNTTLSTAEEFGTMLEYALQHSELDILMLQDGVGVEPHTLTPINDQVTKYFVAARNAADAAGKPFWGNAKLFTNLGTRETPQLISSTMDKIRLQLETIAPHVDKIISFDFHFMDPNDAYTFYPLLGNGTAAADSTMRQNLYDGYTAYWQQWQDQQRRAALPAIFSLLLNEETPE